MTTIQKPGSDREVRIYRTADLRSVRSADGKSVSLVGHAAVYDKRSDPIMGMFVEIVRRGAFNRALKGQDDVHALFDHDSSLVLGRAKSKTLRMMDDGEGLKVEIDLPDTTVGRDMAVSVDRGDVDQMSFGFRKIKDQWSEERTAEGLIIDVRELLEVELFDVSVVTRGAYPQTDVAVRSREDWRKSKPVPDSLRRARLRLAEAE